MYAQALEDYADQTVTAVLLAVLRCAEMRSPDVDKAACHVVHCSGRLSILTVLRVQCDLMYADR